MKTNHTKLASQPRIQLSQGLVQIDNLAYTASILIDEKWHITEIGNCTPNEWLTHEQRQECHQILSWPNAKTTSEIQDLYWDQNISVDILSIDSACQQAKSIDHEQLRFQLVVFPNYPSSG